MIKFRKQKLFKNVISKVISAFAQNNGSSANTDFIHAVLEAINYLVFKIVNKSLLLVNTI